MLPERVKVKNIEDGEVSLVFHVDAREMVASGHYKYHTEPEVVPEPEVETEPEPIPVDREKIKAELTELGVEFNKSAPTPFLVKLLEEEKAKQSDQN